MTILKIDSSITGDASVSRQLTAATAEQLVSQNLDQRVVERDLVATPLSHLTLGGSADADVLDEFLAADTIVVGAPMYNFTVPSQLKAWIDRICVAGRTFRYTEAGPEGLCKGKKVIVVSTTGGLHQGLPSGAGHDDLLKVVFGFIGVTDLQFVVAEGLAYGDEPRAAAMAAAQKNISETLFA